jgi:hypothetical protein
MKASELRLGNCVFDAFGDIFQIDFIGICNVDKLKLQPIPLTEEWLLKFGFKFYKKQVSLNIGGELFNYAMKDEFIIWTDLKSGWTLDSRKDRKTHWLNSLHQLQNLYFALTGEELTITKP